MILSFFKEVGKDFIKIPLKRWIAIAIGSILAFFLRHFIVKFYLEYKMSLGGNLYIDNMFLKFTFENNQVIQFHQSWLYIYITSVIGGVALGSLPGIKPEIQVTLEDEEFDEDLW